MMRSSPPWPYCTPSCVTLLRFPPTSNAMRPAMNSAIPTSSKIRPTVGTLTPLALAETANFRIAPITTSTAPNPIRPVPADLYMSRLLRISNRAGRTILGPRGPPRTPRPCKEGSRPPGAQTPTKGRLGWSAGRRSDRSEAVRTTDDLAHDLGRTATDRPQARVAPRPLHRVLHHVAVPPVQPDRL